QPGGPGAGGAADEEQLPLGEGRDFGLTLGPALQSGSLYAQGSGCQVSALVRAICCSAELSRFAAVARSLLASCRSAGLPRVLPMLAQVRAEMASRLVPVPSRY